MFLKAKPTFIILNFDWWCLKLLQTTNSFFQKYESRVVWIRDALRMYLGMAKRQDQSISAVNREVTLKAAAVPPGCPSSLCPLSPQCRCPTAPWRRRRALHRAPPHPPLTKRPKPAQSERRGGKALEYHCALIAKIQLQTWSEISTFNCQ